MVRNLNKVSEDFQNKVNLHYSLLENLKQLNVNILQTEERLADLKSRLKHLLIDLSNHEQEIHDLKAKEEKTVEEQ